MMMELDWLKRWNLYAPQSVALKDGDSGAELSYQQFYQSACQLAYALKEKYQLKAGDRVAVLSLNEIEYVVLFYALQRLAVTLVQINYRLTSREVDHIISDCSPSLIVYQSEFSSLVEKYPHKLLMSDLKTLATGKTAFTDFKSTAESIAMIIYTSGTTGAPKGAMISQQMLFWNSINTSLRLNLSQTDCTVTFLPFFHTGGWNVLTTPFFHRGAKIILLRKFDGDQILNLSESEKATILFGVPTIMDMMARSEAFKKNSLKSLRYAIVGGEPMPLELIKTWHNKGVAIRQGYGLTEFGPNVFSLNEEHALSKMGSIGFPNFYCEAKIVDENNRELGPNQVGELLLKGPMCMSGYWKNEKATSETIQEQWLRTGDLVKKDEDGFYYVAGRKKDMFKSGGENVYPTELEQVLRTYPGVKEAAVIGVPDDKWGEVGKAFVVAESDDSLKEESLRQHCLQNLAKFKIPKYFVFLPALPKGDSGKILKRNLQ